LTSVHQRDDTEEATLSGACTGDNEEVGLFAHMLWLWLWL